jgi:phosphatidylglycerophosphate synthase
MIERVYPAWMLALVGVAIARGEPAWCALAGAIGLGLRFVEARGWRSAKGGLSLANLLTLVRLAVVVALPALASSVPRSAVALVVVGLLTLDGIDGCVARSRGEASAFGASFDMETDALGVMILSLVLWREGGVGPWILVAGLWRYVFAFVVGFAPGLGDSPKSPIYRWLFCVLMIGLTGAFLPWPSIARASAALGTGAVSFSFLHALARSRRVRGALGAELDPSVPRVSASGAVASSATVASGVARREAAGSHENEQNAVRDRRSRTAVWARPVAPVRRFGNGTGAVTPHAVGVSEEARPSRTRASSDRR